MKKEYCMRLCIAFLGIILVGTGVAFNAAAALGNDPIGIVYDGIRTALQLSPQQLGMASNIVNIVLLFLVFLMDKHYINIGTLIYIIPYGTVVSFGTKAYHLLFPTQSLPFQVLGAVCGCFLLYTGVAMYIVADVGMDPFTGIVMALRDKLKREYKVVKICFDCCCVVLGIILGGKLGVITLITAILAGPMIQLISTRLTEVIKVTEEVEGSI